MGLIQRAVEAAGIRTSSITHLPKVTEKVQPPRSLYLRFPLGRSFGKAGEVRLQRKIMWDLLQNAILGEDGSIVEMPYRWKR